MPIVSSRPPLTEGAANAIASEIKNSGSRRQASEVPLAFQAKRSPEDARITAPALGAKFSEPVWKVAALVLAVFCVVGAVWLIA